MLLRVCMYTAKFVHLCVKVDMCWGLGLGEIWAPWLPQGQSG